MTDRFSSREELKFHPEAESQGRLVRLDGFSLSHNPYPTASWLHTSWAAGWADADAGRMSEPVVCVRCRKPIEREGDMYYLGGEGMVHVACVPKAERKPPVSPREDAPPCHNAACQFLDGKYEQNCCANFGGKPRAADCPDFRHALPRPPAVSFDKDAAEIMRLRAELADKDDALARLTGRGLYAGGPPAVTLDEALDALVTVLKHWFSAYEDCQPDSVDVPVVAASMRLLARAGYLVIDSDDGVNRVIGHWKEKAE